jgi:colicin import membrane protein
MGKPIEQPAEQAGTDLIAIDQINPVELFTGDQADPLLAKIRKAAKDFEADVSTFTGRKEIASKAYWVSRSKTALEDARKTLVADWKAKAKKVDAVGKHIRDYLDALRDEVRQPLTEWEEEQKRIEEEEKRRVERLIAWDEATLENELFDRRRDIERREAALAQAEAERKEREEAERQAKEQKEREERIAREATEKAAREAEERHRKAQEEARQREIDAKLAAERAERERQAAIERAEREKQAAVEAERRRAADEAEVREKARLEDEAREQERIEAERREAERKAADRKHQAKIHREILYALINEVGIQEEIGKEIICAIAKGKISHVAIQY